jgi:hypothetical protein
VVELPRFGDDAERRETPGANSRKVWTLYLRQQREESDAADAPTPPSGETGTAPSRRCIA